MSWLAARPMLQVLRRGTREHVASKGAAGEHWGGPTTTQSHLGPDVQGEVRDLFNPPTLGSGILP